MEPLKLLKIKRISGQIETITGLHIGASRDTIEIGGMDNPVMKNPVNGEPYIPGSSLKGKMRSLGEVSLGKVTGGDVHQCSDELCQICRIFGNTQDTEYGPTRIIVRDAILNRKKTAESLHLEEKFPVTVILEEKTENSIDRVYGKAKNPRPQERVVAGVFFDFEILVRIYAVNGDAGSTDEKLACVIDEVMRLIELDYIGGNGTRGCGQIKFHCNKPEIIETGNVLQGVC